MEDELHHHIVAMKAEALALPTLREHGILG
jgi:hypothetical protein